MTTFSEIRTPRLTLRLLRASDAEDIHAYQRLPEVVEYMFWQVRTLAETREHLARRLATTALVNDGDVLVVGVELADGSGGSSRLIGEITVFLHSVESGQAEIGWAFNPKFQGRGYASEAAGRMLDWAVTELGAHRVAAQLDPLNTSSAAVCGRLGMQQEALFRENLWFKGRWGDTAVYALLRSEWEARRLGAAAPAEAGAGGGATVAEAAPGAGGMPAIRVAAAVLLRERRVLMVTARGRDVLYLPGGKIDDGETAAAAVRRECREEVSVELDEPSIRSLFTVTVQAHGEPEGRMVVMELFAATTSDEPTPSAEVDSVHWVTSADAYRCPPAGVETLARLVARGLID
ncbi:hypothetical protein C5B96_00740 [Subtercola sp. Z020]|uniref:GNAT family N-acetyltransferase n=1 Tax=Subtercola sp. Z020 TaxID=2080582 RepID=UPI000CE90C8B|nr:GNAT family N-acetyltransferase [Subtercola sp. Z020]PPF89703.1 hypothetical protein C5B96_00740 [Subtercola sp. Z020]